MKKYYFIIILLFSFVFLGMTQPVYSETEARVEELSSQQTRIEQMKIVINALFVMVKDSDQREVAEGALNDLLNKIESIQERVGKKLKEERAILKQQKEAEEKEMIIKAIKEIIGNRIKEIPKDEEQQSKEIPKEWLEKAIQEIRDKEQEIREREYSKEELEVRTKECGWCGCDCVEIYPDQICLSILCINYKYNCVYEDGECVLKENKNGGLLEGDINIETIPPYYPPEETVQEEITIEIDAFSGKERLYGMTEEEYRQQLEEETKRREEEGIK